VELRTEPNDDRDHLIEWLGATTAPHAAWDELLGGKAAGLERLRRLGAPTPPGFCLTTHAFRQHLAQGDPARAIAALPDEGARVSLVRQLTDGPLPGELAMVLDAAVARLATEAGGQSARFAVRSSAVGEDSSQASFAGIHETELDLAAIEVPDAVRRCWASLWSERAVRYRTSRGLAMDGAMAVVVQALVPASASAVVFTRHPVTRRADQVLVNAIRGLGEALVSGTATPDEIVLDKATLEASALVPGNGEAVLSAEEVRDLGSLALRLEAAFECAIDIEASLAGGRWQILQVRPITA
jgi:pyruvate,water dikinase